MNIFKRNDKAISPDQFWQWFVDHKAELDRIYEHPTIFDQMMDQAQKYNKLIEFLVGKPNGKFVLFVSCGGVREGIPAVEELVNHAPEVDGWDIVAFKQALPEEEFAAEENSTISYANKFEVNAHTASFAVEKDGDKYDLWIFTPADRAEPGHKAAYYLLLDMLLGEYTVMTKLGGIEMVVDDGANHPALYKLKDYID